MKTVWIIYQYASTPETGLGGRHYYLGHQLAKLGYRVYLIASSAHHLLRRKPHIEKSFETQTLSENFNFVWVKMPDYAEAHSKQRVLNWFLFPWRIQKLSRVINFKPDTVLYSSPSPIGFLGAQRLARKYSARLVFEVRDIWPLTLTEIGGYSSKHPLIRMMQWVEDKAYRDSDAVVSNLKNAHKHMASRGMDSTKFTWIPNGISIDEVEQAEGLEPQQLEEIPKNKFVIGYAGTFGLANDLPTLLGAAKELKNHPDIVFVLVGGGKDKEGLVAYADKHGLDNVIFMGSVEKRRIPSILSCFDVLVVGAKKQPMYRFGVSPNKLFDYLAAGKSIIYHIDSGDYQPVKEARCGYEVQPESPLEIAAAVLKLFNMTKSDRELMGRNGRLAALEQYEYSQLAKKLARVSFSDD